MNRLQKNLSAFVVVALMAINIYSCGGGGGGGDLACKVTCSDVDDVAACEAKCVELLNSNDTLTEALDTN